MVKLLKKFLAGDKVFAKVRGYPPWPAKVEGVIDANTKNAKYSVYFYGTGETAVCKVEELFVYAENKAKFGKPLRRKFFHEGLQQLEQELRSDRNRSGISNLDEPAIGEDAAGRGSNSTTESAAVTTADSDMESGPLVIDESDKKKTMKRKSHLAVSNNQDTPEIKKKRGRGKALSGSMSESTPKQDSALDSQGEESPGKEVVSRSGRKIKPKRFADFSSSEETETMDKNATEVNQANASVSKNVKSNVGARKTYGVDFKLGVANFALKRGNRAAQRQYGISERCVRRWRKQTRALSCCEEWRRSFSGPKTGRNAQLEDRLAGYVKEKLNRGLTVSCLEIKGKALEIATKQGLSRQKFRASHSWVIGFKHRHGFTLWPRDKENSGSTKARGKGKADDSSDNQASPSGGYKKRIGLDKKNSMEGAGIDGLIVSGTTSSDSDGRCLLARTFAGEYVGIKLDVNRPKTFESEKARTQWDWTTARNAMKLKSQLESGEILPEQVKDSLDFNVQVPEEEKRLLAKDGAVYRRNYKLRWLRIESHLLQLDAQIKSNLGLDRANADKCLQAMDEMLALSIDPLMLKKHPHIVETVKRLRRYIGNLADWKLSEEEVVIFKQKAELIRQKAEHIYNKFKAMFTIPEGQSFWQSFSDQVVHFKELTKDMPEEKMFSLMADPACPDSAITMDALGDESSAQAETGASGELEADVEPARSATPTDPGTK